LNYSCFIDSAFSNAEFGLKYEGRSSETRLR